MSESLLLTTILENNFDVEENLAGNFDTSFMFVPENCTGFENFQGLISEFSKFSLVFEKKYCQKSYIRYHY